MVQAAVAGEREADSAGRARGHGQRDQLRAAPIMAEPVVDLLHHLHEAPHHAFHHDDRGEAPEGQSVRNSSR